MKKNILFILLLLFINQTSSYSFEIKNNEARQIKTVLNKHNRALKNHDIEGVKTFYSKDYKSADGFNVNDLSEMLKKTYSAYDNIKYKTKVNSITTFDNWAIAQVTDETSAKLYPDKKKTKEKMGRLEGKSVYNVYLKKNNGIWEIVYDDILMEETSLKYGIANNINMNLITPVFVKKGQEYDLSLKMNKPEDIIALASITREEVTYPPIDYKENFRKFPSSGNLERLVKANKNDLDEYAIASVGFTKVSVNEQETKAKIEILGMAYIMKRINMEKDKKYPKEFN